jgi:hypothetical protein
LLHPDVKEIAWAADIVQIFHRLNENLLAFKLIRYGRLSFEGVKEKETVLKVMFNVSLAEAYEYQVRIIPVICLTDCILKI